MIFFFLVSFLKLQNDKQIHLLNSNQEDQSDLSMKIDHSLSSGDEESVSTSSYGPLVTSSVSSSDSGSTDTSLTESSSDDGKPETKKSEIVSVLVTTAVAIVVIAGAAFLFWKLRSCKNRGNEPHIEDIEKAMLPEPEQDQQFIDEEVKL